MNTDRNTLRRFGAVLAIALCGIFALAPSGNTANITTAVPVPICTKPTSNVSNVKLANYMECLQARTEALLTNLGSSTAPEPTPTPTTSPSPTATSSPSPTQTTSPTPTQTATPTPTTGWPNASNTGVPDGVALTAYTGPCVITSSITIDKKDVAAKCGELIVRGSGVKVNITNSKLPRVENTTEGQFATITIADSNIDGPGWYEGTIWGANFTITRSEITGGQHNVHCDQDNCTITDSWLHDQYEDPSASFHNNAFITNGGSNYTLKHNTLHCTADLNSNDGGCTADVSLFGDFGPVSNVLVEGNLFKANDRSISYCTHAGYNPGKAYPNSTGIRYIDNVFERGANRKCGVYGPVTSFNGSLAGNEWRGNVWDSGEPVTP